MRSRRAKLAPSTSGGGIAGLLADARRDAGSLVAGAYKGPVHNSHAFLAIGHDGAAGRLMFENDSVSVHWPRASDEPIFTHISAMLRTGVAANNGTYVPNPVGSELLGGDLMTVHPLGGCSMGRDRSTGVVDHKCRSSTAIRQSAPTRSMTAYICDGSVIPRRSACIRSSPSPPSPSARCCCLRASTACRSDVPKARRATPGISRRPSTGAGTAWRRASVACSAAAPRRNSRLADDFPDSRRSVGRVAAVIMTRSSSARAMAEASRHRGWRGSAQGRRARARARVRARRFPDTMKEATEELQYTLVIIAWATHRPLRPQSRRDMHVLTGAASVAPL